MPRNRHGSFAVDALRVDEESAATWLTGKRILILERGEYLPRTERNWSSQAVFVEGQYQADESWTNSAGDRFKPALHYFVGGNSKVYGAALFRLRERDFGVRRSGVDELEHLCLASGEPERAEHVRVFAGGIGRLALKSPVAVAEKNRDSTVDVRGDDIGMAVAEIGNLNSFRL